MKIEKLSNTQKMVALTALVVAACTGFFDATRSSMQLSSSGGVNLPVQSVLVTAPIPEMRMSNAESNKILLSHQKANLSASTKVEAPAISHNAWQMADYKSETPKIPLNEKIVAYTIVQLEQHPANLPSVGEQVQLPMLHDQQITANVESTTVSPNGDYTWSGHLQGHGTDYPVVMTYGEHSIFATITTPEGSYTMESLDGLGWLYKNPAEIELSTPGSKDYLDVDSTR